MKILGKFKINPGKVINNEELVNLRGGYWVPGDPCPSGMEFRCECVGSVGTWHGCYSSKSEAESDGEQWCASGTASCHLVYYNP